MSLHNITLGTHQLTKSPTKVQLDTGLERGGISLVVAKDKQGFDAIPRVIATSLARDNPNSTYAYYYPPEMDYLVDYAEPNVTLVEFPPPFTNVFDHPREFSGLTNVMFVPVESSGSTYGFGDIKLALEIASSTNIHVVLILTPEMLTTSLSEAKEALISLTCVASSGHHFGSCLSWSMLLTNLTSRLGFHPTLCQVTSTFIQRKQMSFPSFPSHLLLRRFDMISPELDNVLSTFNETYSTPYLSYSENNGAVYLDSIVGGEEIHLVLDTLERYLLTPRQLMI